MSIDRRYLVLSERNRITVYYWRVVDEIFLSICLSAHRINQKDFNIRLAIKAESRNFGGLRFDPAILAGRSRDKSSVKMKRVRVS